MGGLQDSIAGLKERQRVRFRELQQQQALCERDLALFADRLDSPAWQDAAMPAASTATAPVEVTVAAHEARSTQTAPCLMPQADVLLIPQPRSLNSHRHPAALFVLAGNLARHGLTLD